MLKRLLGLLKEAFRASFASKSRTVLSGVCIGIGIAGITLIAALGEAAAIKAGALLELYGTDAVMVSGGSPKKRAAGMRTRTITTDDVRAVRSNFPDAYIVAPLRFGPSAVVSYANSKFSTEIFNVSTSYTEEWNWKVTKGRDLNADDNKFNNNVCTIGAYVDENLFHGADPIGKQIKLGRSICEVVGVHEEKSFGMSDDMLNNFVNIPDSVFSKKYAWRKNMLNGMRVRFYDPSMVDIYAEDLRVFLRKAHNLDSAEDDDFQIFTSSTVSAMIFSVLGAIGAFLLVITLVVIIVGGFVTANMFLLATQSRIKEIGIKRAFGATSKDIFIQFLMEFIIITMLGMILGFVVAFGAVIFINSFGFIDVRITPLVFTITAIMSMIIALIFGMLPAKSAAKISPIEAIRTL